MKEIKQLKSANYNFIFNTKTGFFARWGKTKEEDPSHSPYGPEIADIEIVQGDCMGGCPFCYKSNGQVENHYMDLATYKKLLSKIDGHKIIIELENGNKIKLNYYDEIKLTNGKKVLAKDLEEWHDVCI